MTRRSPAWIAVLAFLAVASFYGLTGGGQRSPWTLMTLPVEKGWGMTTCLGWTSLFGRSLIHSENWYTVLETLYFNGAGGIEAGLPFTINRGVYSFWAAMLSPALGIFPSCLVLNLLAWGLCVAVVWKLCIRLFDDSGSALVASLLAMGGIGMITHLHDYSAHLAGIAVYYVGVYWILASGMLERELGWRAHAAFAAYVAAASIVYNTALMLLGVYVIAAWPRQRLKVVLVVAAAVVLIRPLWLASLKPLGVSYADVEGRHLSNSLAAWSLGLRQAPVATARLALRYLSEYLFCDFPLTIVAGWIAFWALPAPTGVRHYGAAILSVPLLAGMVFAQGALARGYLVYGLTIWIFCWAGRAVGLLCQKRGAPRAAGWLLGVVLISGQWAWSSAHLRHNLGPVLTYFLGWDHGWPSLHQPPAQALSLTGQEKTPQLYHGTGTLAEAGAIVPEEKLPTSLFGYSALRALLRRLPLAILFGLCLFFWLPMGRARWIAWAVLAAGWGTSSFWAGLGRQGIPQRSPIFRNVRLPAGQAADLHLRLSPECVQALSRLWASGDELDLHIAAPDLAPAVQLKAGADSLLDTSAETPNRNCLLKFEDPRRALEALQRAGEMTVRLINPTNEDLYLAGWQRLGLPGRDFKASRSAWNRQSLFERDPVLPSVEIRIYRPDGSLVLLGF